MRNWKRLGFSVVGFLVVVVFLVLLVFFKEANQNLKADGEFSKVSVPEMRIALNGVSLDEIKDGSKNVKYLGNRMTLDGLSFDDVEVKGRGNATWWHDKRPYQIKLAEKADLLGLGKRRKWILLSNYIDQSNLRTDMAFYIEKMLGEKFAYRGEFVELYVNDEYEGLYYLTRGIEVGKNAVDLKDSLGVLVELDDAYGEQEEKFFVSGNGERLTAKDAVADDNIDAAMANFMESFNALEEAVRKKEYDEITEIVDIESFAKYYVLEEFIVNWDAYFTSQYFYKDGPDDKIHAGPAWDFDIALDVWGSVDPKYNYTKTLEPKDVAEQYGNRSGLFARLLEIPRFRMEVEMVFDEYMSGRKKELMNYAFKRAAKIYQAAKRNNEKWKMENYAREVKRLFSWIERRYDYFENEYSEKKYKNYPFYDRIVVDI